MTEFHRYVSIRRKRDFHVLTFNGKIPLTLFSFDEIQTLVSCSHFFSGGFFSLVTSSISRSRRLFGGFAGSLPLFDEIENSSSNSLGLLTET